MLLRSSLQSSFTGTIPATAKVARTADAAYFGQSTDFTVFVETSEGEPPEILIRNIPGELMEGLSVSYEVALATAPSKNVTVRLLDRWSQGFIHDVTVSPKELTFLAREALQWQRVELFLPDDDIRLGESTLSIIHSAFSEDITYDSANAVGAESKAITIQVKDDDEVGVCLGKCALATKYDFYFDWSGGGGFSGPVAVDEVRAKFALPDGAYHGQPALLEAHAHISIVPIALL